MTSEQVELIRVRIMQEAYDLADRNDSEGYNSVKVMCSEVLKLIQLALSAEREACAKVAESYEPRCESCPSGVSNAIRARGEEQPYATQAAIVESQTHGRMQIDPATGSVSIGAIRARGET